MDYRIQRWIPVIEAQANSGLPVGKWCDIKHISRSTFHRWSARVRNYIITFQSIIHLPLREGGR